LRVLLFVHHRNAAAGVFAAPARAAGHELVEWVPHEAPPPAADGFGAAIVLGAEAQVDQEGIHPWLLPEKALLAQLLERDTPLLGVCFGSQLLAEAAGAPVRRAAAPEIGWHEVELTADGAVDPLLGFLPRRFETLQWHHYEWLLPPRAVALARSARCLQAFRLERTPAWGVQFHPEVTHADYGSWLDDWDDDPGAVASGLDPEAIRVETAAKIAAWNEVGHALVERFLDLAATAA
jgi:GMP synthase-like glutamine amidotransferase